VGWALLHNGDHVRAAAFFDEALRLDAGCDWAQAGALEAAKHQYRSYRMIAAVKDWFIHQPIVLRAVYGLAAIIPACMVLVAILKAFDPMVRSRVGNEGTALVMGPILFAILLPVMFHDYIFLWLVRRKRAALTSTGVAMRNAASGHLWLLIPGLLGGLLAAFMQRRSPEILGVLLGLLPGANAMWIVRKEFAGSASRKWWVTYAVTLIVAGPLVALLFGDVFRGHDRMWILIALLVPIVPPCLAVEWHKRQKLQRQHDEALSAALRPPHS